MDPANDILLSIMESRLKLSPDQSTTAAHVCTPRRSLDDMKPVKSGVNYGIQAIRQPLHHTKIAQRMKEPRLRPTLLHDAVGSVEVPRRVMIRLPR